MGRAKKKESAPPEKPAFRLVAGKTYRLRGLPHPGAVPALQRGMVRVVALTPEDGRTEYMIQRTPFRADVPDWSTGELTWTAEGKFHSAPGAMDSWVDLVEEVPEPPPAPRPFPKSLKDLAVGSLVVQMRDARPLQGSSTIRRAGGVWRVLGCGEDPDRNEVGLVLLPELGPDHEPNEGHSCLGRVGGPRPRGYWWAHDRADCFDWYVPGLLSPSQRALKDIRDLVDLDLPAHERLDRIYKLATDALAEVP